MKRKMIIMLIFILLIICLYKTTSLGVESGTVRMEIKSTNQPWVNVTVSESYEECESLNSITSTLGTTQLQGHLTTDYDWSAMAIFSVSQYGGVTGTNRKNNPTSTTNNASGVYNIGDKNTQTTGILNTAKKDTNSGNISGLFNDDGTVKKYVKQWNTVRTETGFVGFNETYGWLGSWKYFPDSPNNSYPCSIKSGLFGVSLGGQRWRVGRSVRYNYI